MALSAGEIARLRNLCRIFRIDPDTTESNPAAAFTVVSMLYAMPAIADHAKRHDYGNRILQGTQPYFTPSDGPNAVRFFSYVQGLVIEIQEFPSWFSELTRSPEELVSEYRRLKWAVTALQIIGIGAGGSAFTAGIKEMIKKPNSLEWKTGAKTVLTRWGGRGAIFEGVLARYGESAAALQPAVLVIILTGTALYEALRNEMERIRNILLDKLQSGQMSNEFFSQVFKEEINPNDIKRYWEMK
jgi:hypothetical protein